MERREPKSMEEIHRIRAESYEKVRHKPLKEQIDEILTQASRFNRRSSSK